MTDKYGLTEASNQLTDAFDTYHASKLAEAFLKAGDITPEGWKKFATQNRMTPKVNAYLMDMVDGYNQLVGSKNRVKYNANREGREQEAHTQQKILNELTGEKKAFEVDNMGVDRQRKYEADQAASARQDKQLEGQLGYWDRSAAAQERKANAQGGTDKISLERYKQLSKKALELQSALQKGSWGNTDIQGNPIPITPEEKQSALNMIEVYQNEMQSLKSGMPMSPINTMGGNPSTYLSGNDAKNKAQAMMNTFPKGKPDQSIVSAFNEKYGPEAASHLQNLMSSSAPSLESLQLENSKESLYAQRKKLIQEIEMNKMIPAPIVDIGMLRKRLQAINAKLGAAESANVQPDKWAPAQSQKPIRTTGGL